MRAPEERLDSDTSPPAQCAEAVEDTTPPLIVPVRALVVAPKDARLRKLTRALQSYRVSSHVVEPHGSKVFDMLGRDPRVSVLVVRIAGLGSEPLRLLQAIAFDQPSLHIVVEGATGSIEQKLRKLPNCVLFSSAEEPSVVAEGVARCLNQHFFDPAVIESLSSLNDTVLQDADMELVTMPPLLRIRATVLGELTAMTLIGGENLNGRISVSGPPVFFERLVIAWLGRPPANREDIWDCAGELCNRVTGTVRSHYLGRGLDSRQSIATIVEGSGVSIRCMTTKPGLVLPFELDCLADPVYVELVLASKGEDRESVVDTDSCMSAGELTFL